MTISIFPKMFLYWQFYCIVSYCIVLKWDKHHPAYKLYSLFYTITFFSWTSVCYWKYTNWNALSMGNVYRNEKRLAVVRSFGLYCFPVNNCVARATKLEISNIFVKFGVLIKLLFNNGYSLYLLSFKILNYISIQYTKLSICNRVKQYG